MKEPSCKTDKCPRAAIEASHLLGKKWVLPIIYVLYGSPKRFNQLKVYFEELSNKVLSDQLKMMESEELVEKYQEDSTSYYRLTPAGEKAGKIARQMEDWWIAKGS